MSESAKRPVLWRIEQDELDASKLNLVKEDETKIAAEEEIKFPYVVRRIYSAVYQRVSVVFTTEKIKAPK